jgi:hypothetical protein
MTMTKTRSVLHRRDPNIAPNGGRGEVFQSPADGFPAEGERYQHVWLAATDWIDLGSPDTITVTIEPGDLLND